MAAIFSFASWITILLLLICSSAYFHTAYWDPDCSKKGLKYAKLDESKRHGCLGIVYKLARVGERLSLPVSIACVFMAVHTLFF